MDEGTYLLARPSGSSDEERPDLTATVARHHLQDGGPYQQLHAEESGTTTTTMSHRRRGASELRRRRAVQRTKWPVAATVATLLCAALTLLAADGTTERLFQELRMLRGLLLLVFMLFLIGVNVRVWRLVGIDYVGILDLDGEPTRPPCCDVLCRRRPACDDADPGSDKRKRETGDADDAAGAYEDGYVLPVNRLAIVFAALWVAAVLVVIYAWELGSAGAAVTKYTAFALWLLVGVVVCVPMRVLAWESQRWVLHRLWRIVAAPFYRVRFADTWVADQITSLPLVFLDFEYTICQITQVQILGGYLDSNSVCLNPTVGVRQILNILPSWLRLVQCLRAYYDTRHRSHLINAGKYFSSFPVVVAASLVAEAREVRIDYFKTGYFFVWLALALIHAVYVFSWDVIMDWGLLRQQTANPWLRACLLYRRRWLYYSAIILDVVLRFAWTMKMSLSVSIWFGSDMLLLLLGSAELLRRFMWNFFRLEHEQVKHFEELSGSFEAGMPMPAWHGDGNSVEPADEDGGL